MLHLFISHSVIEENVEELVVEEVVLNNIKQKDDRGSDDMEVGIDLEDNFDELEHIISELFKIYFEKV